MDLQVCLTFRTENMQANKIEVPEVFTFYFPTPDWGYITFEMEFMMLCQPVCWHYYNIIQGDDGMCYGIISLN